MSQIENTVEGDLAPAEPQHISLRAVWLSPKTRVLLASVMAFVGREIVPRLADTLLAAWDRRAAGQETALGAQVDALRPLSTDPAAPVLFTGSRSRYRHRAGRDRA